MINGQLASVNMTSLIICMKLIHDNMYKINVVMYVQSYEYQVTVLKIMRRLENFAVGDMQMY